MEELRLSCFKPRLVAWMNRVKPLVYARDPQLTLGLAIVYLKYLNYEMHVLRHAPARVGACDFTEFAKYHGPARDLR